MKKNSLLLIWLSIASLLASVKLIACKNCTYSFIKEQLNAYPLPFGVSKVAALDKQGDSFINDVSLVVALDGSEYVLKLSNSLWGYKKMINEVSVINFLYRNSDIPVPEIVWYSHNEGEKIGEHFFILMKKMDGLPLSLVWVDLKDSEKHQINSQLAGIVAELRKFKFSKIGSFGSGNSLTLDEISPEEVIEFPDVHIQATSTFRQYVYESMKYYRDLLGVKYHGEGGLEQLLSGLDILIASFSNYNMLDCEQNLFVLSHLDLSKKNILVDKNKKVNAVLDWEWSAAHTLDMEAISSFDFLESEEDKIEFRKKVFEANPTASLDGIPVHQDFYELLHLLYCTACSDEWEEGKKLHHTARFIKSKLIQRKIKSIPQDSESRRQLHLNFVGETIEFINFLRIKYNLI